MVNVARHWKRVNVRIRPSLDRIYGGRHWRSQKRDIIFMLSPRACWRRCTWEWDVVRLGIKKWGEVVGATVGGPPEPCLQTSRLICSYMLSDRYSCRELDNGGSFRISRRSLPVGPPFGPRATHCHLKPSNRITKKADRGIVVPNKNEARATRCSLVDG